MKEQNVGNSMHREPVDVEQRLAAYYGPLLPEQLLSQAAWQNLRLRLGTQARPARRHRFRLHLARNRFPAATPAFIEDAFARVGNQAHILTHPSMLRCSLKPHLHEPIVQHSWFGRLNMRLRLPLNAAIMMGQAELDVLLTTGLARSVVARKPAYRASRLLLTALVLVACFALILFWMHHQLLVGSSIAVALCACAAWLLHMQARSLVFRADTLIVRWLGRERACSGLHALADRSRTPRRKHWSEPSLAERIERVCGPRVEARENQLTLVG
jgi:hypothetical protein